MNIEPLVSILMITYNRAHYIGESIESVINSSYQNWELIIVDDCSTDNTQKIVDKYLYDNRIRYIVNDTNIGQFKNRNKAASMAKGKYLKYLDSDDLLYSFAIKVLVESMEKFPDAAMAIASQDTHPTEVLYPIKVEPADAYRDYFFRNSLLVIGPSGTMFKKLCFDAVNGYSKENATADTELMLRLGGLYPCVRVQPSFFYYRVHDSQVLNPIEKIKTYTIESFNRGKEVLLNDSCPLDKSERRMALRIMKMKVFKIGMYQILRKGNITLGAEILKSLYLP